MNRCFDAKRMRNHLEAKDAFLKEKILKEGAYIWGAGKLGSFALVQCNKKHIGIKGFIDSDIYKCNAKRQIYEPEILKKEDIVILASFYYPDIIEKLESMGIQQYIYYEELAYIMEGMDSYYPAFVLMFEEMEANKEEYRNVYRLLADEASKEIYENIIRFRESLDIKYTKRAYEISLKEGSMDLDKIVLERLDQNYVFYDVGGFDGDSTKQYIRHTEGYRKIYFFEPDREIMKKAMVTLKGCDNIEFICAGVGETRGSAAYNAKGNGAGTFLEEGSEHVNMVVLDDYVDSHKSYIKLDVEGFEEQALKGAENCIRKYHPLLSVSVYHLPGDIHKLIRLVLSWNPEYKVYMRHYTKTYADTRVYFI